MDTREARDHLQMVDQILRQAEGGGSWACPEMGVNLVGFGLGAGLLNLAYQFSTPAGGAPLALVVAGAALLVASLAYMAVWTATARRTAERVSLRAMHAGRVMGAVWCSVTVAAFCQPHIFNQWSASAIWTLGGAISMLVNGFLGERRALGGGLILLASLVVANYVPAISGYALAAGFLFGYVAVGVMYLTGIRSAHGRG